MRKYMQNAYYKVVKVVAVTSIAIVITINKLLLSGILHD